MLEEWGGIAVAGFATLQCGRQLFYQLYGVAANLDMLYFAQVKSTDGFQHIGLVQLFNPRIVFILVFVLHTPHQRQLKQPQQ